ncbi:ABC transporter ATP-binding protein [Jiella avicenniae]|uniref:Sn-glycerol-3-phosphate ABC transporter ATP-binding protein UgpC n=1 Tax=Jiella avicenniae TaxID=2907202 RepID=A0A9X1P1J0_9HYPH|nr:sn-glycerol-3-phosphate ABC transporter ATP-binding protein UgpC [Jiella avicenniae]MCE7029685.1 sn-glycerol-3-phosphate ABC transporter ATP-binding protein UgpC [Jiella avicenniae]
MASLTCERLSKSYGAFRAVKELQLDIPDGEFLVIVGPSGCGKSTALRCIAGLETVTSGRLLIGEDDVTTTAPRNRDIAMVFQSYALYPHMDVRQNLAFGLRHQGVPKNQIDAKITEVARILELGSMLDRRPRELSGGQRQRVALGRAIVRQPRVFLMDEPLSNLDAKLRVQTRAELVALQNELGTTTIYVTHDQVEAMTMGHRIAILDAGKLQQLGTPQEIYDKPANRFVATFIGSPATNVLRVRAERSNGRMVARQPGIELDFGASPPPWLAEGGDRDYDIGIRPEQLFVGGEAGEPLTGDIRVSLVEPLGPEKLVHFVTQGGQTLVTKVPTATPIAAGDRPNLRFDPAAVHAFDPNTGANLSLRH